MTPEDAKLWVEKKAKSYIDVQLRKVAVTDLGRYGHIYHTNEAAQNYNKYCGRGSGIDGAECAGFASKVFGYLKGKDNVPDSEAPSVLQVGLLPPDASFGHNVVIVNAALDGSAREISLDPMPLDAANWVVVDGWRAGLGWAYDDCVFVITQEFVNDWGKRMEINLGWNPDIPAIVSRGQTGLKSTGRKLW